MQIFTGVTGYTNTRALTLSTHRISFIMTAAQANATGSMTDPLSTLSLRDSDPKAAVRCHAGLPCSIYSLYDRAVASNKAHGSSCTSTYPFIQLPPYAFHQPAHHSLQHQL